MILKTHLRGKVYEFKSLREVMGKANEEKSGDNLAGVSAESAEERVAAKAVLQHITLKDLFENPAVPMRQMRLQESSLMVLTRSSIAVFRAGRWQN